MNAELEKKVLPNKVLNIFIVSLFCFILLMLAIVGQMTYTVLNSDSVYKGVYVSDTYIGELSKDEAAQILSESFQGRLEDAQISLNAGDVSETINYSDIDLSFDIPSAVDMAYAVGRTGNIFNRLHDIWEAARQGKTVDMAVNYDKEKLANIVSALYNKTLIEVKQADILIQNDKITIRSGHNGRNIDKMEVLSRVESMIKACKGGTVDVDIITTTPEKINLDDFYNQIIRKPQNATTKLENRTVKVVPHIIGRSVSKDALAALIADVEKTENTEKTVPITFIEPEITTDEVYAKLFRDTLYTISTKFSTYDENGRNRSENIKLGAKKINGKILAPGDTFSFNETVGPRTEEYGYKAAHAYIGGKVVDDFGGGICQVSSTLYNAVLFSDLEVVERRNHMFTVGYVAKGTDATVSYGQLDFKFRNSTNWPIKLESWVTSSNELFFSIKGTNESPGRIVEVSPQVVKVNDYKTIYIDDPDLPEGETRVKQSGITGYVVDTYKIVKQDGKILSQTKLHTSVYQPLDEEIIRGTKKVKTDDEDEDQDKDQDKDKDNVKDQDEDSERNPLPKNNEQLPPPEIPAADAENPANSSEL
jgi:vancomycin resistance protein YoaR